jgi:hypothetical protein
VITAGQRIGILSNTGYTRGATGIHAHIELMLFPLGFDTGASHYFCGGMDNILHGGKELNEITWYDLPVNKSSIYDEAQWEEIVGG